MIGKNACKGICIRYKINKNGASPRYSQDQKRCQACDIFIKWDGIRCPCCKCLLRLKPRNKKDKDGFHRITNSTRY